MKKQLFMLGLFLSFLAVGLMSCNDEDSRYEHVGDYVLTVASEKRMYNMRYPDEEDPYYYPCYLVKYSKEQAVWTPFHKEIRGLNWQEGYEYVVKVGHYREKGLMDDDGTYVAKKLLSKIKKTSEGMPEDEGRPLR